MNILTSPRSIFSNDKFFNRNRWIGSPILNLLGLHVVRIVLAQLLTDHRIKRMGRLNLVGRADAEAITRQGFILKRNFLPEGEFQALRREVTGCRSPNFFQHADGSTLTDRLALSEEELKLLPQCRKFASLDELHRLIRFSSTTRKQPIRFFLERLRHGPEGGDPQKDLHSDTFHATFKFWYFISDVTSQDGPFGMVPRTHRLDRRRVIWEYRKSIRAKHAEGYDAEGSFRAHEADRRYLQLAEVSKFAVPGNTLIIANTRAFHRRGEAEEGRTRVQIFGDIRPNPFKWKI